MEYQLLHFSRWQKNLTKDNNLKLFFLIPIIFLIIAPIISFPYGFYVLLRLVVTVSSGYIIYRAYKYSNNINSVVVIFSLIFLLFNPIFPVHLSREIWLPLDFLTAGVYGYGYFKVKN